MSIGNRAKLCRAGVGDVGVLDVIVSWVGKRETHQAPDLHVGGLSHPDGNDAHVRWYSEDLEIGDEIVIRLVDAEVADSPTSIEISDPNEVKKAERRYYNAMKKEYERKRKR